MPMEILTSVFLGGVRERTDRYTDIQTEELALLIK